MQVMPTGIVFYGICKVQTLKCVATEGAPITAVWVPPGRTQVNVCKPCLDEQIRQGKWVVKGASVRGMKPHADIAVYSPDKTLQLIVEIKNRLNPSPDWLAQKYAEMRYNPLISQVPFLMLALPARFYLWRQQESQPDRRADFTLAAAPYLTPYLRAHKLSIKAIGISQSSQYRDDPYRVIEKHFYFQTVVKQWLKAVIQDPALTKKEKELRGFFHDSGLYPRIANGTAETDALIDTADLPRETAEAEAD